MAGAARKKGKPASTKQAELSAGAFRALVETFHRMSVPIASHGADNEAAYRREELKALIEGQSSDARWRELLQEAQAAAEHGAHESLMLRFPASACTDHGRAVTEQEPRWPGTLPPEAAALYRHWQKELQPRGFAIAARVLEFPGGFPGDVGLFLRWE